MKILLKSIISLTLLTSLTYAACSANYCQKVEVTRLYVVANGDILIETDGDESALNCATGSYFSIPNANASKNIFYSMLLTAKTTKAKLFMAPIPNSPTCELLYMFTDD